MTDAPTYSAYDDLAQAALDHVRKICKGNGVRMDAITVLSHKITLCAVNAGTYLELKPVTNERSAQGKITSGQMVGSREEAARQVTQTLTTAATNAASKAQISDLLLRRPDQGFGLHQQNIPLDFLKREFTWHELCQPCRGSGQGPCTKCQGRRTETCSKCSGRGLMPCPMCLATGMIQGARCSRCSGQRYVPCDKCHRSGMMQCLQCNGSGTSRCATCGGHGWTSHVMTLTVYAVTYFEYERKSVPSGAADKIETSATNLLMANAIKVRGRIADDRENLLGASYEVEFPYGEIVFAVGKKHVTAAVFGFKADITGFPHILDKMVGATVEDLEEAAQDVGSVATKIQKATRYRLIAQTFLNASRTSTKKTVAMLMKQYDIGLSLGMAEKIALLADQTTARITRKPRYYGLAAGLAFFAVFAAGYYLYGIRSMLAAYMPDRRLDFIFDLAFVTLGCFATTTVIQMFGANAIRKALGHLMPRDRKNYLVPKAGLSGLIGYAGVSLITLGIMEAAARAGATAPYWYQLLRNFLAGILPG